MSGIEIGIDPVALQFGHLALRWYGIFFAIAVVAGVGMGVREAVRKGVLANEAQNLAVVSVVGGSGRRAPLPRHRSLGSVQGRPPCSVGEAQVLSLFGLAIGLAFVGARMWSSLRAAPAITLSGAGE